MEIFGVVILYHPEIEEVIKNIKSYIDQVSKLFVFANSYCSMETRERLENISPKVFLIQNEKNEGIAKPLNKALERITNESGWLLTMDQDSYFESSQAVAYFGGFNRLFYQSQDVAVVCPRHSSGIRSIIDDKYKEVEKAITSGSLVNIRIAKELNGFNPKLFIDSVDFEYCYRCIVKGYKIVQFQNIYLDHSIGVQKQAGYFSVLKKTSRSIHSPLRIYFMVRNFLYVSAQYKNYLPDSIKQQKRELLVILKNNIFFSGRFFRVLFAIVKGYLHFKLNKFSS
jgi:rhamnosyltransferase